MARTLFPILGAAETPVAAVSALPMFRDAAWDYVADKPVFRGGEPVIAEGAEAVRSWAWRTLKTARYRHEIFSPGYGCELMSLAGQPYREDTKLAEAVRYVRDTLLVCPYITGVSVTEHAFQGDVLTMNCSIDTIYGEVGIHV